MSQISDSQRLTFTDYARRRCVSKMAVSRAVKDGRLRDCLATDEKGRKWIVDADLADREWEANTSHEHRMRAMGAAAAPRAVVVPEDDEPPETESLADSSAREKHWKAKLAELKFKEAAAELVPARDVERRVADDYAAVRVRLLALSSVLKQDLPHLTVADVARLEERVREALEELSAEGEEG